MGKFKRHDKIIAISQNKYKVPQAFIVIYLQPDEKHYVLMKPLNKEIHTVSKINVETHFRLAEKHEVEIHFGKI